MSVEFEKDFVCAALGPWQDIWRTRHQLMSRFAEAGSQVLWLNPAETALGDVLRGIVRGRLRMKDFVRSPVAERRPRLWEYHEPLYAPRTDKPVLKGVTGALARLSRRLTARSLGFRRPILWLQHPSRLNLLGNFEESLVVYHCVDEYSAYPQVKNKTTFQALERRLLARADLVLVTSQSLLDARRAHNAMTFHVPNAVDVRMFAEVTARGDPPTLVRQMRGPIIGYVGVINEKLDYSFLRELAAACPDWSFVLVGPVRTTSIHLAQLKNLPNVHFPGEVDVGEVPRYISSCDVCLLPYVKNEWTRNIDALKLYEYLACGRPIVSTDVPTAYTFPDAVKVAPTALEAREAVQAALLERTPAQVQYRQQLVEGHSWEARIARIKELLLLAGESSKSRKC